MSKLYIGQDIYAINKTQPIPIKSPTSINYSLSTQNFDNLFNFKLEININNNKMLFNTTENKKYTNIITSYHKIRYEDISYFKVYVNSFDYCFELDGNINNYTTSYVTQANNIFIEFTQDSLGFVNCICYFIDSDLNKLCISPPT
jgi:hypothetical protein